MKDQKWITRHSSRTYQMDVMREHRDAGEFSLKYKE